MNPTVSMVELINALYTLKQIRDPSPHLKQAIDFLEDYIAWGIEMIKPIKITS